MAEVKGTAEMTNQAAKGMALFAKDATEEIVCDVEAATAFKEGVDKQIAELNELIKTLSGKENLKQRKEKSKEASDLSKTDMYVDACKAIKGQEPKHGHFIKSGGKPKAATAAPVEAAATPAAEVAAETVKAEKKADKKPKKEESAGISKAERDELEKLKTSIVELKTQLKAEGMTGGQINKDERVATMVARMNELKEKQDPGSTASGKKDEKKDTKKKKALSADQEKLVSTLQAEIEIYRAKLQSECGFNKKEIANDPDMADMVAELNKLMGK